ncbi:MAG: hypothetical protein IPM07_01125 [Anaerolineales bacterium]|nr:hypothetical protein [Anaerolineales bacterium]
MGEPSSGNRRVETQRARRQIWRESVWGGGNYTPADVVGLWRSEEKDYHGEQIDSSNYKVFGHFTQMIWKDTKELGGGKAAGTSGVYWVCRYRSAGNIIGQKPYSGNFWTELVIRDAEDDQGKIPYQGKNWWQSPDITVNPGPDTDKAIHLGEPNQIVVCVWNKGTSDLPVGVRYTVSLGWDRTAATVPYPLPKDQVIGQVEEVLGSNWKKDTPRKTSFTWRPLASKIPFGHHCLVAWVNALQDPVLDTPAVNYDDNRAQRNIEFCKAPSPGEDGYGRFWLNPQPKISDRSLEITFRYGSDAQLLRRVRLHLPCSVEFNEITGGELVERSEADDWVIGNIDPAGQVRFDGIGVSQPELLTIEVWAQPEGAGPRGAPVC